MLQNFYLTFTRELLILLVSFFYSNNLNLKFNKVLESSIQKLTFGDVMLKRFLCVYAIAFSCVSLQAEDTQTLDSTKPATEALLLQEEQKVTESKDKNLLVFTERAIAPGALACDLNEENCAKPKEIIEEIPAEAKISCGKNDSHFFACSKCN